MQADLLEDRKPKDEDFIETQEGLLFRVLGYLHPPDRYTAYLHYDRCEPATSGPKAGYRKVPRRFNAEGIAETIRYLEQAYPHYVYDCPVQGVRLSMVPHRYVRRYLAPERRLPTIVQSPGDALEELVRALALSLVEAAGIPLGALGVTGSVLAGNHDPTTSDVDLVSYGRQEALKLKAVLAGRRPDRIEPVEQERLAHWVWELEHDFPLSPQEAAYLVGRRWNCGGYGGRFFSLWAVRADHEITEAYGRCTYRSLGKGRVRATVLDAANALFLPAAYAIGQPTVLAGPRVEITEIVAYDMRYVDAFDKGIHVEAAGRVEAVGDEGYRLVIGAEELAGRDYIRPIDGLQSR